MAISYVGGAVGTRAGSTSTTTQSLTGLTNGSASSPAEGDLVIITVTVASQGRNQDCAISGWSTVGTQLNSTSTTYDASLQVSYKFMGSTPDTEITIPATGNIADAQSWAVHVFRGVDSSTPFDVTGVSATGTGVTMADPAAITPTTSGAYVYVGAGAGSSTSADFTSSDLSDFRTARTNDTNDSTVGAGYIVWTSGEVNPAQFGGGNTNSGNSWVSWTLALRPAATTVAGLRIPLPFYWGKAGGTFTLTVADAAHSNAVDNVALTQANALTVADALHAHSVDNVALTQANVLVVSDAAHAHTVDSITLSNAVMLAVADALHAHAVDAVALTQANVLAIQDALHGHSADSVALTQANILIVNDALHAHLADLLTLSIGATVGIVRGIELSVAERRIYVLTKERAIEIAASNRSIMVN